MDKNELNEYKSLLNSFQGAVGFNDVTFDLMLGEAFRQAYQERCLRDGAQTIKQKVSVLAELYVDEMTDLPGAINHVLDL